MNKKIGAQYGTDFSKLRYAKDFQALPYRGKMAYLDYLTEYYQATGTRKVLNTPMFRALQSFTDTELGW